MKLLLIVLEEIPLVPIQTPRDRQTMEEACYLWKSCEFEGPQRRKIFSSHGNCQGYIEALTLVLYSFSISMKTEDFRERELSRQSKIPFFSSLLQELNSDKVKPEFSSGKKPEIEYSGCHEYCTRHHAICALSGFCNGLVWHGLRFIISPFETSMSSC